MVNNDMEHIIKWDKNATDMLYLSIKKTKQKVKKETFFALLQSMKSGRRRLHNCNFCVSYFLSTFFFLNHKENKISLPSWFLEGKKTVF